MDISKNQWRSTGGKSDTIAQTTLKNIPMFFFLGTDGSYFPACPVAGEYSGRLTDNPNLCAKLSSNCNKLDVMFFVITPCDKITDIIEGM